MDCLLCYKVFLKEKEFGNYNPDPQVWKKAIVKLFGLSNDHVQGLSDDLLVCFGCHLSLEVIEGLVDQLEEPQRKDDEVGGLVNHLEGLQKRVDEAKIEIKQELIESKEKSQAMAERTAANRMSPSSRDRCTLLRAIEALNSSPQEAPVPMDQAEEDGGNGPIGENSMDEEIQVQNQPPETRAQVGVEMANDTGNSRPQAPDHAQIDTGDSESSDEENQNQDTDVSENEDSNESSNGRLGVLPAGLMMLKELKIILKRVQLSSGMTTVQDDVTSNLVPSNSKGGHALRNLKPSAKTSQIVESIDEDSSSDSEPGDGSTSENDAESEVEAGTGVESGDENAKRAPGSILKEFTRLKNGSFKCKVKECLKIFARKKSLYQHRLIHGPRNFKCSVGGCGKEFTFKVDRDNHIKMVHERRRDFKCTRPRCGKEFSRKSDLVKHSKFVHEGKKVLCVWPGCGKRFQPDYRNTHVKLVHEGKRDFKCGVKGCAYAAGTKGDLKKHMSAKHKKMGVAKKKKVGVARVSQADVRPNVRPINCKVKKFKC